MQSAHAIIPRPLTLERQPGIFSLTPATTIVANSAAATQIGELLAQYLRPATGWKWAIGPAEDGGHAAAISLVQAGEDTCDDAGFADESYSLDVTTDGVRLQAQTSAGLARGIQTLRQLLPPEALAAAPQNVAWTIPCVHIEDAPRFRWRGMHLDVCRHFFSVQEVERFIDLIALHKFNRLHLHLTEDQGWRIEIKQYPRLTEVGSIRPRTLIGPEAARPRQYDSEPYGGFYTQQEIRQLVEFAERRRIVIVPEIDMPGHMQAAISAYPELGNTRMQLEPRCHWGISQHILNMEESTVQFMKNVLDEVMDLFPGMFIHIGGDEAVKHEWAEDRRAQQRMAELGLAGEDEMQNWFIRRMGEHITARGRRMIGWDEILEGGNLPEGASVMSWRGEQGGVHAASSGFDAVMAPANFVYFDHYQAEPIGEEPLAIGGLTTTAHVYSYEPLPTALPAEKHRHILGAQGQLWSEYIGDAGYLEYMAFPRACALAEVLWLTREQKNYRDFLCRLTPHRQRLVMLGVNAHPRP